MLSFKPDKRSLRRLDNAIDDFAKGAGISLEESIKKAIGYVGRAAYKTTVVAKPKRKVTKNAGEDPKFPKKQFPWKIEHFSSLGKRFFYSNLKKKKEVLLTPEAQIKNAGLAKSAWWFALKKGKLGGGALQGRVQKGYKYAAFKRGSSMFNLFSEISNKINYTSDAMRMTPTRVFNRGVQVMARTVKHKLESAQKKAGL